MVSWAGGVAQAIEHFLSKREALSSNSKTDKKTERKKRKKKKRKKEYLLQCGAVFCTQICTDWGRLVFLYFYFAESLLSQSSFFFFFSRHPNFTKLASRKTSGIASKPGVSFYCLLLNLSYVL
jgi:hypothetical protein